MALRGPTVERSGYLLSTCQIGDDRGDRPIASAMLVLAQLQGTASSGKCVTTRGLDVDGLSHVRGTAAGRDVPRPAGVCARAADELGYDGFFRSDHYMAVGGVSGLPGPTDSWITLAGLAVETRRVRLGTLVSAATLRAPSVLALQVAQVDDMSDGRVELGLGAGWYAEEHAAHGIPFPERRFDRLDEQLQCTSPVRVWVSTRTDMSRRGASCSRSPIGRTAVAALGLRHHVRVPTTSHLMSDDPWELSPVVVDNIAASLRAEFGSRALSWPDVIRFVVRAVDPVRGVRGPGQRLEAVRASRRDVQGRLRLAGQLEGAAG